MSVFIYLVRHGEVVIALEWSAKSNFAALTYQNKTVEVKI